MQLIGLLVILSVGSLIVFNIWQSRYRLHILYGIGILVASFVVYQLIKLIIRKIRLKNIPTNQVNLSEVSAEVARQAPDFTTVDEILSFVHSTLMFDADDSINCGIIDLLKTNYLYCYTNHIRPPDFQLMRYNPRRHSFMKERDLPADWDDLRKKVLHRDQYCCVLCGETNLQLQVHHIRFRAHGGDDALNNLVAICHSCHDTFAGHGTELKGRASQWSHHNHLTFMKDQNEKIIQYIRKKEPKFIQMYMSSDSELW